MRVLMVSNYYESHRGGVEIVAGRLATELAGTGFEVTWVAPDVTPPPDHPKLRCVPIIASNLTERLIGVPFPFPSLAAVRTLFREAAAADVIVAHDSLYPTTMIAAWAAARWSKPLALIQHIGAIPYKNPALRLLLALANAWVAKPLLGRADQVVFISQITAAFFAKARLRRPAMLIFNGVDTSVFSPASESEVVRLRGKFGLPITKPVILFVGRFVERKGLGVLRRAAELRPDWIWAFAGWGQLNPINWRLDNVRVFESLSGPSIAELYKACDLLALPSRGEGFPLVIQEALASGLAVVCGDETVAADPAASPHLIGIDLAGGEEQVHADRLCAAINDALVQVAGRKAERTLFARDHYSWERAAESYAEMLWGIADSPFPPNLDKPKLKHTAG